MFDFPMSSTRSWALWDVEEEGFLQLACLGGLVGRRAETGSWRMAQDWRGRERGARRRRCEGQSRERTGGQEEEVSGSEQGEGREMRSKGRRGGFGGHWEAGQSCRQMWSRAGTRSETGLGMGCGPSTSINSVCVCRTPEQVS